MLKCIGFLIVILSSISLGYLRFQKLNTRVIFLTKYLQFINYLEVEIRYSSDVVFELIKKYSSIDTINNFLLYFINKINDNISLPEAWNQSLYKVKDICGLDNEDVELIYNFGNNLGKSDIEGQISNCKLNKELIDNRIALALDKKEKKGKLYFILYILGGLTIVLFFL